MKKIKSFRLFENLGGGSLEELHTDIKEILLELEEVGFIVLLSSPVSDVIYLNISKRVPKSEVSEYDCFQLEDIEEGVERVARFLEPLGWKVNKLGLEDSGEIRSVLVRNPFLHRTEVRTEFSIVFFKSV